MIRLSRWMKACSLNTKIMWDISYQQIFGITCGRIGERFLAKMHNQSMSTLLEAITEGMTVYIPISGNYTAVKIWKYKALNVSNWNH